MEWLSLRSPSGLTGGKKAESSADARPELIRQRAAECGAESIGEFLARVLVLDRSHLFDRIRRRERRNRAGDRDVQSAKQSGDQAGPVCVASTRGVGLAARRRGGDRV